MWVLGPNSLSVLTGPEHMRQRKLLLPPFHGEHLRKHEDLIVGATRRVMADWPLGRPMRMQPRTRLITLEVIMGSVFGVEAERMSEMQRTIVALMGPKHVIAGLRMLVRPTQQRPNSTIGRGLDRLDAQIYAEIENRRGQSDLADRSDIMSMLLRGARRGRRADDRRGSARRAGHAAAGRSRDDRDGGLVGDRASGAPSAESWRGCWPRSTRRARAGAMST